MASPSNDELPRDWTHVGATKISRHRMNTDVISLLDEPTFHAFEDDQLVNTVYRSMSTDVVSPSDEPPFHAFEDD